MPTLATLLLTPGPHAVPQAMAWLHAIAQREQWHERTAFKLGLCLDEALTNIVMYGFPPDQPLTAPMSAITLTLQDDGQRLDLNIVDNGVAFDPTGRPAPARAKSLDDAVIGGHGLRLMRHYLHDIHYERSGGHNRLRLTATHDPSQG
ncbi:MAG TPA: ATP-binding protein [Candidimonas sp.]|nr:ATP-binding protein [Candidimonas sp.]